MADHNKHQNQQQNQQPQNQQQGHNKPQPKPQFRIPLWRSIRVGWAYLWTMADEALLSAIYMLPVFGVCYALDLKTIQIPVANFWTLWAIGFTMFMLQNSMFGRRREQ